MKYTSIWNVVRFGTAGGDNDVEFESALSSPDKWD